MGNFIGMVFGTLKENGIDTSKMTIEEAIKKFNDLDKNDAIDKSNDKNIKVSNKKTKQNSYINKNNIPSEKVNKTLFHQTMASSLSDFKEDYRKSGSRDIEVPNGIFLKETDQDIGLKGKNQLKLNVSIDNALIVKNREELRKIVSENNEIKELQIKAENFDNWLADEIDRMGNEAETDEDFDKIDKFIEIEEKKDKEIASTIQKKISEYLQELGYDGVIMEEDKGSFGRKIKSYIVFDKKQLKEV